MKHSDVLRLSCKIFFVKGGKVYKARQMMTSTISGYSGYYGFYPRIERQTQVTGAKLTRRRDIVERLKLNKGQGKLVRQRSGSWY